MTKVKVESSVVERRDGVRANRVLAVRHKLFRRGGKKLDVLWSLATSKNMSVSGLLFLSPVPYKTGDILDLDVVMSGMIDVYRGLAQVVRVIEMPGTTYDIAVRYIELKSKTRSARRHK